MRITTVQGSITGSTGGVQGVPGRIFRGWVNSTTAAIYTWPPSSGTTPASYNIYRSVGGGSFTQLATGIVPIKLAARADSQIYYIDGNTPVGVNPLTPNTSYTYQWTAVDALNNESAPGPSITITTLKGTAAPPTLPTPPADPASWIIPYSPSPTGTRWTVTQTSDTAAGITGTDSPAGNGKGNNGCSLQWAANGAIPGDTVVLTAGLTYTSSASNQVLLAPSGPAFQFGATNVVYVMSSEAPEIKSGGALPAFSNSTTQAGGNYVTPANKSAMPTIMVHRTPNTGQGIMFPATFNTSSGYFRFIGIAFVPEPSNVDSNIQNLVNMAHGNFATPLAICNHIYFDRCYFGNDSANYLTTFSTVLNGITSNCNNLWVHQCYFQGFYNANNEAHAISLNAGGPYCIENNNLEAVTESLITGGLYTAENQNLLDGVVRYNNSVKQPFWFNTSYGNVTLTTPPVSPPTLTTPTTATVGGTIPAGTYFLSATPLDALGVEQNNGNVVSVTTTGTTSTISTTWATTGAGGYKIYVGNTSAISNVSPNTAVVSATLGSGATSITLTSIPATVATPPAVNTGIVNSSWPHQRVNICTLFSDGQTGRFGFISDNGNGTSTLTWAFISGTGLSATVQIVNPMGFWEKNHYEWKLGIRTAVYGNNAVNACWGAAGQQQGSGILALPRSVGSADPTAENPWAIITDFDCHDNQIYNCGQGIQIGSADNARITAIMERVRIANNTFHINPFVAITNPGTLPTGYGITNNGPTNSVTIDNNTVIICDTNVNPGIAQSSGLESGSLVTTSAGVPTAPTYMDCVTVTDNIFDGRAGLRAIGPSGTVTPGTTSFNVMFNNCVPGGNPAIQPAWAGNVTVRDPTALASYPIGTVAVNVGYAGLGMAVPITNNANPPVNPGDWNIVSGTFATASTTGGPIGYNTGAATPLSVTTAALTAATVGTVYAPPALTATGGHAPYTWNIVSALPNRGQAITITPGGNLQGTLQFIEPITLTVQVNDSAGATAQKVLTLTVAAGGAVSIVTPSLPNASSGGYYNMLMTASGGIPPYRWAVGTVTGSTSFSMDPTGLLHAAPTAAGSNTVPVTVWDSTGDLTHGQVTANLTVVVDSVLRFNHIDNVDNVIRLPTGWSGTKYGLGSSAAPQPRLSAAGGSGSGYNFSLVSGSLNGLTLGANGTITGVPNSAGAITAVVKVTDGASNTATATILANILSKDQVTRPAYNTGAGFFVHADGTLRDSSGFRFTPRGTNRTHYDSNSNPAFAKAGLPAVRYNSFTLNTSPSAPNVSTYVNGMQSNHINQGQWPIFVPWYTTPSGFIPQPPSGNNVVLTGTNLPGNLSSTMGWMVANVGGFASVMNSMALNIANEFLTGSVSASNATWLKVYQGVGGTAGIPVTNVSVSATAVITVNSSASTNPFANCLSVCIFGGSGTIQKVVGNVTATGGSVGAWTVTTDLNNSSGQWVSGGALYGGAVAILRAAGYTCPFTIDVSQFASTVADITVNASAVLASDPMKSIMFAVHQYNNFSPFQCQIASVTTGSTTTLNLNSSAAVHPFAQTTGGGTFFSEYLVILDNLVGTGWSGQNGNSFTVSNSNFTGSAGAWKVTIPLNSTGFGAYTANSGMVYDYANTMQISKLFASLRAQGICAYVEEFGPYLPTSGGPPTFLSALDVIDGAESYGIGWQYWTFDDNTTFYAVLANLSTYAFNSPSDLTVFGRQIMGHPRLGVPIVSISAPAFL